jgi:flagellar motor switch protein FliG
MVDRVSGKKKAALLLLSLGKDVAVQVFKHLRETEVEELTLELTRIPRVAPKEQTAIIEEFFHTSKAQAYVSKGGLQYAKEILDQAMGTDKAGKIIDGLTSSYQVMPFEFLEKADPTHVVRFIQEEQPQTIALILAYLEPRTAAQIISLLPESQQAEVARRIAVMDQTPPEVVRQIEDMLKEKLDSVVIQDFSSTGGIKALSEVISKVDRSTEKTILEHLSESDPELAEEIKKLMFIFEDVIKLDDRSIQRIMQEVDGKELSVALKTASEELKEKIYRNMSDRAVETLKEEMEYMGPVRVKQVEEAQQKIVFIIRNLEESGEIVVSRGGEEEEFV